MSNNKLSGVSLTGLVKTKIKSDPVKTSISDYKAIDSRRVDKMLESPDVPNLWTDNTRVSSGKFPSSMKIQKYGITAEIKSGVDCTTSINFDFYISSKYYPVLNRLLIADGSSIEYEILKFVDLKPAEVIVNYRDVSTNFDDYLKAYSLKNYIETNNLKEDYESQCKELNKDSIFKDKNKDINHISNILESGLSSPLNFKTSMLKSKYLESTEVEKSHNKFVSKVRRDLSSNNKSRFIKGNLHLQVRVPITESGFDLCGLFRTVNNYRDIVKKGLSKLYREYQFKQTLNKTTYNKKVEIIRDLNSLSKRLLKVRIHISSDYELNAGDLKEVKESLDDYNTSGNSIFATRANQAYYPSQTVEGDW